MADIVSFGRFQISTFATKLGVRNIAFLGSGLLLLNYVAAIFAAVYMPQVCTVHTVFSFFDKNDS